MPKICDLIAEKAKAGEDWVSYEFFPPRTEQGVKNLVARFERMKNARAPLFCDMTWGAGGSTSELTMDLTLKMKAMGLDLKRSDTPVFVQDFLSEILYMVLTGKEEKDVLERISEFRAEFKSRPGWEKGSPKRANNMTKYTAAEEKAGKTNMPGHVRAAINWNTLKRVRDKWKGKLIVKGVMSPDDAIKIKDAGADAIQVSNHGGRQLDSAPPAINMLPLIRKSVGSNFPLIFDSGIRSGSDIVRALAFGADYAMIGRPVMYAMGADGKKGLRRIVEIIKEEVSTTLGLVGLNDINEVTSEIVIENTINKVNY